ncbi:uncharacterized protein LOC142588513 isoform X5 [Dermacentor variabilis]|uniref:uncharacterized protein LOC142588513 isoform X5 n=1 Tax=Dermacentor variabilis TaxID=34621 RepID=UPI003F5C16B4
MAQCRSSFANVAYSAGPSMAAVMVLGLLLAVTARDAANGTREVSSSEANKTREESSKKSQRACFLPNGPQHKEKCEEFENHWVNRTGGRKDKPSPNDDHMLTELLLCQYDYTEDKDLLLREFNNVKSREDIVKMMEDLKNCMGTTLDPVLNGTTANEIEVMEVFVKPVKKMRAYIESQL